MSETRIFETNHNAMKTELIGQTMVKTDLQGQAENFLTKLTQQQKDFANHNLIVDITSDSSVSEEVLKKFHPLSKSHRKGKKSFVIVAADVDYGGLPDSLVVVPTLQEAHDMIEMEEIERDLGF